MSHYLIVQYPYEIIEIALCYENNILQSYVLHKFQAVGQTIPTIQKLLQENNLTLKDVVFIGVNVGPGPYNSLRALLTMMNGIHHVLKIPLVALSALDLLDYEYRDISHLAILKAHEQHVFYSIQTKTIKKQGSGPILELIKIINDQQENLLLVGNGVEKYYDILIKMCASKILIIDPVVNFNTLQTLATQALNVYQKNNTQMNYLKPIYFENF